jgi:hypothetical protein
MPEESAQPHADSIGAVSRAFSAFGHEWVIIGAVAVGLVAVPRFTSDLDVLTILDTSEAPRLMDFLAAEGFVPLFSDALGLVKRTRILPVRHPAIGAKVDIALGCMPFEEEVVARSVEHVERGVRFRVPTAEDLIILKAIAFRDQDIPDIRRIAETNPKLDRKRIKRWVTEYAELLEKPGLWPDVERLLERELFT